MLDPIPTFAYLITKLRERHPDLAFLHAIQPRIIGNDDTYTDEPWTSTVRPSNQFIRELWAPRPLILAGGFSASTALAAAEEHDDLVAFGRYYISNVSPWVAALTVLRSLTRENRGSRTFRSAFSWVCPSHRTTAPSSTRRAHLQGIRIIPWRLSRGPSMLAIRGGGDYAHAFEYKYNR